MGTYIIRESHDVFHRHLLAELRVNSQCNRLSKIIKTGLLLSFFAVHAENKLIFLIKISAYTKAITKAVKKPSKTYQFTLFVKEPTLFFISNYFISLLRLELLIF